jgi:hypothetical protein
MVADAWHTYVRSKDRFDLAYFQGLRDCYRSMGGRMSDLPDAETWEAVRG